MFHQRWFSILKQINSRQKSQSFTYGSNPIPSLWGIVGLIFQEIYVKSTKFQFRIFVDLVPISMCYINIEIPMNLSKIVTLYIIYLLFISNQKLYRRIYFKPQSQSEQISHRKRAKGQHLLPFVLAKCSSTGLGYSRECDWRTWCYILDLKLCLGHFSP